MNEPKETFMHRVFGILTITLLSVVMVFAQGPPSGKDDHDDKAPIQLGYAVITPTTGGT